LPNSPFEPGGNVGYINERLRIADAGLDVMLSREAMEAIHGYSKGIPRVVNLRCEQSLINSFAEPTRPFPAKVVEEIAREFALDEFAPVVSPVSRPNLERDLRERDEGLHRAQFTYLPTLEHSQPLANTFGETKP
jgi:general secretion pathway protein A